MLVKPFTTRLTQGFVQSFVYAPPLSKANKFLLLNGGHFKLLNGGNFKLLG